MSSAVCRYFRAGFQFGLFTMVLRSTGVDARPTELQERVLAALRALEPEQELVIGLHYHPFQSQPRGEAGQVHT
jgi:hypothetical protein